MDKPIVDFKTYLKSRWNAIYTSPDSKFIFSGDIAKLKVKQTGSSYVQLN